MGTLWDDKKEVGVVRGGRRRVLRKKTSSSAEEIQGKRKELDRFNDALQIMSGVTFSPEKELDAEEVNVVLSVLWEKAFGGFEKPEITLDS